MLEQVQKLILPELGDIAHFLTKMKTALSPRCKSVWMLALVALFVVSLKPAGAYDILDPQGSISIRWDIITWTGDGYIATVNIINNQLFRGIEQYQLGWHWAKKEVIWNIQGARAVDQGDCSKFIAVVKPHSCSPKPVVVDLLPNVAYNQQFSNCCRDGVITPFAQDPKNSLSSFQIQVGRTGVTNTSIYMPRALTLAGPGYSCSAFIKVPSTKFKGADGSAKITSAFVTWNATCSYSQKFAQIAPTCCVSLTAFYSKKIVPCRDCACGCSTNSTTPGTHPLPGTDQTCLIKDDKKAIETVLNSKATPPKLYCTKDMCPVKIHWHLKENYKQHWRAKITIQNRNLLKNYTNWNIVVQHQNFVNFTRSFSFTHKALTPFGEAVNDTGMFWGVKYYNDMLMQAGPDGNVQSELLFAKDSKFTLSEGWGFPSKVYFNGDECVLPEADDYPFLPSDSTKVRVGLQVLLCTLVSLAITLGTFL